MQPNPGFVKDITHGKGKQTGKPVPMDTDANWEVAPDQCEISHDAASWLAKFERKGNTTQDFRSLRVAIQRATLAFIYNRMKDLLPIKTKPSWGLKIGAPRHAIYTGKPCIQVVKEDCLEIAKHLSTGSTDSSASREVCVLNMANAFAAGGGYKNGYA